MAALGADGDPPSPRLVRAAKGIGLGYAALAVIAVLPWDALDEPEIWPFIPFLLLWYVGPVLAAALLVKASRLLTGQRTFLGVEAVLVVFPILFVMPQLWPDSGRGALWLIVLPVYQYAFLALVWLLAMLMGWRARDGWR